MNKKKLSTEERKIQIAEVALRIIANDGLKKMTANVIANELGISDSAIFKHFKNKEEILNSAIDRFEYLLNSCYPTQDEKDPIEKLGKFLINRMEMVKKHPEIIKLVFNERLTEAEGEESRARVQKVVSDSIDFITDCLKQAKEKKKMNLLLQPKIIVWMIVGILYGNLRNNTQNNINELEKNSNENSFNPINLWTEIKNFLTNKS
jgi:AcrR family transcriptional regulator